MRRVFKSLSLPKSSLLATSIGAAIRLELLGIAAIVGAIGKVAARFDDIGVGVATIAELGMFANRVEALEVGFEMFIAGVGALAFFPKLGFPLVLH